MASKKKAGIAVRIAKVLVILLLVVFVSYYISLVVIFNSQLKEDFASQEAYIADLMANPYAPIDEASFVNFDVENSELQLNEISVLATHNSYKTMPTMYISYPLSLFFGQRVKNGWYEMLPFTEQLNQGYRGLELDVCYFDNKFLLMHDPFSDWRTHSPDFELALKEIKLWSATNPDHIPIHIMLQVRNQFCIYSPKFQRMTTERLKAMDELIEDIFGDAVITPGQIKGEHATLNEAVLTNPWPKVKDSLGKIYFTILFDTPKIEQNYLDIDPIFATQQAFVFIRPNDTPNSYSSFILADDPTAEGLSELIAQGYILRTRIDEQFDHSTARYKAAINLGSTILSTDYPIGNKYEDGYVCKLTEDGKTVIAKGSIVFE